MSNIPTEALFAKDYMTLDQSYAKVIISRLPTLDLAKQLLIKSLECDEDDDDLLLKINKLSEGIAILDKGLNSGTQFRLKMYYIFESIKNALSQPQDVSYKKKPAASAIDDQIKQLIKHLEHVIAQTKHIISLAEGRRDLAFNYLLSSARLNLGWQIKSPESLNSWNSAFYAPWRIDKHRVKTAFKKALQIKVMPMEISWFYLASCSFVYFLRHQINLEDLHFRFAKTARAILDFKILTPEHGAVFELTNKIGNKEVCLVPYDKLSGCPLSSHPGSLKLFK